MFEGAARAAIFALIAWGVSLLVVTAFFKLSKRNPKESKLYAPLLALSFFSCYVIRYLAFGG